MKLSKVSQNGELTDIFNRAPMFTKPLLQFSNGAAYIEQAGGDRRENR